MEKTTLLQTFALNKNGRIVGVDDVERGKACECFCPKCREPVIARQGEQRVWHFAHESGGDCAGSAETALHEAAKQVVLDERRLLVPALEVRDQYVLPNGRRGVGAASLPSDIWDLDDARDEVVVGAIKTDVFATHREEPLLIEVAVTHFVDDDKLAKIQTIGIPCLEIAVDAGRVGAWTWETLRATVLDDPLNRQWVFHPGMEQLRQAAKQQAIQDAYAQSSTHNEPSRMRFRLFGVPVHLVDRGWGLCLWSAYNENTNPILKGLAQEFGGSWSKGFKNWVLPVGVKSIVLEQLESLGAIREE